MIGKTIRQAYPTNGVVGLGENNIFQGDPIQLFCYSTLSNKFCKNISKKLMITRVFM